MSLFFCSLGHIHENLLTMSLFFCLPGHICQKNAICPIAADIRDIMQRNDSICPTVPKKRDITEQKFSICPQDRLAYYRFFYVTVSSPLTCDRLRFSRMRISAISRCAVFEIPFSL